MKKGNRRILVVPLSVFLLLVGMYVYHMNTLREGVGFGISNLFKTNTPAPNKLQQRKQQETVAERLNVAKNLETSGLNDVLSQIGVTVRLPGQQSGTGLTGTGGGIEALVQAKEQQHAAEAVEEYLGTPQDIGNIDNWFMENGELFYQNKRVGRDPIPSTDVINIIQLEGLNYEDVDGEKEALEEKYKGYLDSEDTPEQEEVQEIKEKIDELVDEKGYTLPEAVIQAEKEAAAQGYEIPQSVMKEVVGQETNRPGYSDAVEFVESESAYASVLTTPPESRTGFLIQNNDGTVGWSTWDGKGPPPEEYLRELEFHEFA